MNHTSSYPYVRKVSGRKYQLRLYLGNEVHVNLGLFDTECAAGQALRAVLRVLPTRDCNPITVWLAVQPLIESGVLPPRLLPRYVRQTPDGYVGRVRRLNYRIETRPMDSPVEAYHAVHRLMPQASAA